MNRIKWLRLLWLAPLPVALLARLYALGHAQEVERLFSTGIYPRLAAPVSRLMALCPVPVVELMLPLLLVYCIHSIRKRRLLRIVALLGFTGALFVGGWGMNYLRLPLEETLGLPVRASTVGELTLLCEALVAQANQNHAPSPEDLLAPVPRALDAASAAWPIPRGRFAVPKYALLSPLLTRSLIEGITSPFTLEALVNREIPPMSIPFAACHEAAHIRGFAREEDANLIAYLACSASENAYFRYSGAMSALLYSLNALRKADPDAYAACRSGLSPPARQDLGDHAAFWTRYAKTKTAELSTAVNDVYLQAASGGGESARSYGRVVDLLLALQRRGPAAQSPRPGGIPKADRQQKGWNP